MTQGLAHVQRLMHDFCLLELAIFFSLSFSLTLFSSMIILRGSCSYVSFCGRIVLWGGACPHRRGGQSLGSIEYNCSGIGRDPTFPETSDGVQAAYIKGFFFFFWSLDGQVSFSL